MGQSIIGLSQPICSICTLLVILLWHSFIYEEISKQNVNKYSNCLYIYVAKVNHQHLHFIGTRKKPTCSVLKNSNKNCLTLCQRSFRNSEHQIIEIAARVIISSHKDFSFGGCFYNLVLYFVTLFIKIIEIEEYIFSQKTFS